jgi:tetratricopeptide (TPR) repeat protein/O-antigen ligase
MQSKVSLFCERLIEAGWLAAVIVTPLFFNIASKQTFEPDKVAILRSIALVMAAAWIVRAIDKGKVREGGSFPFWPLLGLVAIFGLANVLATVASVDPRSSLWGSYDRRQGLYATLSYVVIALLMVSSLRRREQVERLVTVIILTSLPVSLYAIVQHYGGDPMQWSMAVTHRVMSTLANPIFVAAYLIMVVPLTLERLMRSVAALRSRKTLPALVLLGCYFLLLLAQVLGIYFTQSRGPVVGLAAGLFLLFLLWAVTSGSKGWLLAISGLGVGLAIFLLVLNLPHTPLQAIKQWPYLGRFGSLLQVDPERAMIWQGVMAMNAASPERALLGYGPEAQGVAFYRYYPPELYPTTRGEVADRAHNQIFDTLATTGLLGLAAYLLLWGGLFYYALKGLGLISSRRQGAVFILLLLLGGALGALAARLLEGTWRFIGMGVPLGMVAALALYAFAHVFLVRAERPAIVGWREGVLLAVFAALVAHFIETQSGIAVTATLTYFWIYAALLLVVGYRLSEEPAPAPTVASVPPATTPSKRREKHPPKRPPKPARPVDRLDRGLLASPILAYALLAGLIVLTMGFDFITFQFQLQGKDFFLLGIMAITWLFCGLVVIAEMVRNASSLGTKELARSLLVYSLGSLGLLFVFLLVFVPISRVAAAHGGTALVNMVNVYYLFLFLALVAVAIALLRKTPLPSLLWRRTTWWLYPLLGLATLGLVFVTNLSTVQADVYYNLGAMYHDAGKYDQSIGFYRRALDLSPDQPIYHLYLGMDTFAKVLAAPDETQRLRWFEEARREVEKAIELSPLEPDYPWNLGDLYRDWARLAPTPAEKAQRLVQALEYYQKTVTLSPNSHGPRLKGPMIETTLLLGDTYWAAGALEPARTAYQHASALDPQDYRSHKSLAVLYQQWGRREEALAEARLARDLAPASEQPALEKLIKQLEAQKP